MNKRIVIFSLLMPLFACGGDSLSGLSVVGKGPGGNGGGVNGPGGDGGAIPKDSPDRDQQPGEAPRDYIDRVCGDLSGTISKTFELRFADPGVVCPWEQGDNDSMLDWYIRARIEQTNAVNLPQDSVVCALDFDFEPQAFYYDDHFLVTFDDVVILSSFDFSPELQSGDQQIYAWSKIRGIQWTHITPSREHIYCPSADSYCSFPNTEEVGVIKLDIEPSVIQNIMARDVARFAHEMRWVTTGDDNPETDCSHNPVHFTLTVTYI